MNRRSPWIGAFLAAILLSSLAPTLRAQNAQVEWLRVEANDDVIVEVEHRSLKIEKDGLIRANFKTTLFSEQLIPG
jgi:hypothetical protein